MKILVTYGSKRGGTEGIAEVVAEALRARGHQIDLRSPRGIESLEGWDAVVVGGGLYANRWHRDAKRFVRRHVDELRQMPVWMFSSGPVGDEHQKDDIPPTRQMRRLMALVRARGHVTFGGRLDPASKGFIVSAMIRNGMAGDWRDMAKVRAWAGQIDLALEDVVPRQHIAPPMPQRPLRVAVGLFTMLVGLTATGGGLELLLFPQGSPLMGIDASVLGRTVFPDFLIPGLLLMALVGLPNLAAGILTLRRHVWGEPIAMVAGASISVWIVSEISLLGTFHPLHLVYLALGAATLLAGSILWRRRWVAVHRHGLAAA